MNVKFGHVFAGKAGRPGKPDRQPVIERRLGRGLYHTAPYGTARFKRRGKTANVTEYIACSRTGHTDHGDTGPSRSARQRKDCLGG